MTEFGHIPVLLREVMAMLAPRAGQVYADATAGLGGHAAEVGVVLGAGGTVVLSDLDAGNLARAEQRVATCGGAAGSPKVMAAAGNFAMLPRVLADRGMKADMLLADLGFASSQMDDSARGLSFMREGPLDMRLDPSAKLTAAQLVASASEVELANIIFEFGEDRMSRRIARRIVEARASTPIVTTTQLAEVVKSALPRVGDGIHPATRTFQALRIAVNDELGNLNALLDAIGDAAKAAAAGAPTWLAPGARAAIISFHSLEDRPVKQAMGAWSERGWVTGLSRKPVTPSDEELERNPRSRSAKLRGVVLAGG